LNRQRVSISAQSQAEHVQVKFYSAAGLAALEAGDAPSRLPDAKKDPVRPSLAHSRMLLTSIQIVRYVVTNDGIPFRAEDWKRLKKIAEGNPDEEKIGA
jgi:hypothetical protein